MSYGGIDENVLVRRETMKQIGNAIRSKNGSSTLYLPDEMPSTVLAIEPVLQEKSIEVTSNGVQAPVTPDAGYDGLSEVSINVNIQPPTEANPNYINFIDYDGRIVESWSRNELKYEKYELPENPSHDGLTAQGWNWTLNNLKWQDTPMNVGQMYATDDGSTRIRIFIPTDGRMDFQIRFGMSAGGSVSVDFGDGSAPQSYTQTSVAATHSYTAPGRYVISLKPTAGTVLKLGEYGMFGDSPTDRVYGNMVTSIEIGSGVTSIPDECFYYCIGLKSITIPDSVASIGEAAFRNCSSLLSAVLPAGLTAMQSSAFNSCYSLRAISSPYELATVRTSTFANCYSLTGVTLSHNTAINGNSGSLFNGCWSLVRITIPMATTSFSGATNIFSGCNGLKEIHFVTFTPPVLMSSTFSPLPDDCLFYVPGGAVNNYKTATNWSSYASRIVGE